MSSKRTMVAVSLLPLLAVPILTRSLVEARAILSPNAPILQVVRLVLSRQSYQIAIPHRSIFEGLESIAIPSVSACCGTGSCNNLTAQPMCAPGCPQGYCYCGCRQLGCTPYFCTQTTANKLCLLGQNNGPGCGSNCEGDYNQKCQSYYGPTQ